MKAKIIVIKGDITDITTEAIVNAANPSLLGGGGVDGAIHKAAGPKLLAACAKLKGCQKGQAKITRGYNLKAKYIIHTVGPIYGKEKGREKEILASCYLNSLKLAKKYNIKKIAFPAIATGFYKYPKDKAVDVVYKTVIGFLKEDDFFEEIIFVLHSKKDFILYNKKFSSFLNL